MAGEDRTKTTSLVLLQRLKEEPYSFGFYQAFREIECAYSDKARIGTSSKPVEDPVRFGQEPSMVFAPSTLASVEISEKGFPPRLQQLFFGVFGPNGPLPLHLTEYARDRMRNKNDHTFARFTDIFHHRLLSLFYRAWADAEPVTSLDRLDDDRFSNFVGSQIGIGISSMRRRDAMPDFAKLFFAGRLGSQAKSAEGLLAIIRYYFEMPLSLNQFIGEWMDIPSQSLLRLGSSALTCALGETTTLGARAWECQNKFRLTFGPLDMTEYQRMLPGGSSLIALIAIVRNYTTDEYDWDVRLILDRQHVRPAVLGVFGQLGWTTWLTDQMLDHDPDHLYINPMQEVV